MDIDPYSGILLIAIYFSSFREDFEPTLRDYLAHVLLEKRRGRVIRLLLMLLFLLLLPRGLTMVQIKMN